MEYIDLHLHTTASDGLMTAKETVVEALEKGMKAIAITDHDTIGNVIMTMKAGKKKGLEVIPGIEISVDDKEGGHRDIHILGYFIDVHNQSLMKFSMAATEARIIQKKKIIKKLNELGYRLTFADVRKLGKGELGRPHIGMVLMKKYPDEFPSMDIVFETLLGSGKPGYIHRDDKVSMQFAIDIIKNAGGIPVLSHPCVYPDTNIRKLIKRFKGKGGMGVETYYPYDKFKQHKGISKKELKTMIAKVKDICKSYNLIETGGSDSHGTGIVDIGESKVPYSVLKKLKSVKDNR